MAFNPQLHAQVSFAPPATYFAGNGGAGQIVAADVNNDGKLDLICPNGNGNSVTVLTNSGNGVFGFNGTYPVGIYPISVAVADVNGDSNLDLIVANWESSPPILTVLTNNGTGNFGSNATLTVADHPVSVVAADVNGDGKMDLICADYGPYGIDNRLSIFTNNGTGGFKLEANLTTAGEGAACVVAADVNGDGKMDLICADAVGGPPYLSVLTNNGTGYFPNVATYPVPREPYVFIAADLNGDGKVDLISANTLDDTLTILTNNGTGIFGSNATLNVTGRPGSVCAADVNGDGKLDLIVADSWTNTLTIFTNDGSGGFVFCCSPHATTNSWVTAADVNGDGKPDLICNDINSSSISVLISVPTLTSTFSSNNLILSWPSSWTNWTLLQNPDLTTTNWTTSAGIVNDNTNKSLTITPSTGNLFLRLFHP